MHFSEALEKECKSWEVEDDSREFHMIKGAIMRGLALSNDFHEHLINKYRQEIEKIDRQLDKFREQEDETDSNVTHLYAQKHVLVKVIEDLE